MISSLFAQLDDEYLVFGLRVGISTHCLSVVAGLVYVGVNYVE
jgi:hypothetical protein